MWHKILHIAFLCWLITGLPAQDTVRGLWVVRNTLEDSLQINEMLHTAYQLGFTDLFVQVRGRGDAYYNSRWEPRAESLATDFDPLRYLLQHPLRKYFRVHAWINVFYIWSKSTPPASPRHLVNQHPEWLERRAHTELPSTFPLLWKTLRNEEGLYLSPHVKAVQLHLLRIIQDIVTHYPVDGIHLDYIRYGGSQFGFHPEGVNQFQKKFGLNPYQLRLAGNVLQPSARAPYELVLDRWAHFLQDQITRFVWRVNKVVKKQNPRIILSAAVKPDISLSRWRYYQDWGRWLKEGLIDWALPMNYNSSTEIFLWRINQMLRELPPDKIVMGISLFNQPVTEALNKIALVQQIQLKGVVLFSYNQIKINSVIKDILTEHLTREFSHETRDSGPSGQ